MQTRSQTLELNKNIQKNFINEIKQNNYNLRSKSKKPLFEVNINFDEASSAWKQNKISIGNGCYIYKSNIPTAWNIDSS